MYVCMYVSTLHDFSWATHGHIGGGEREKGSEVGTYSKHSHSIIFEYGKVITKATRLTRASGCVCLEGVVNTRMGWDRNRVHASPQNGRTESMSMCKWGRSYTRLGVRQCGKTLLNTLIVCTKKKNETIVRKYVAGKYPVRTLGEVNVSDLLDDGVDGASVQLATKWLCPVEIHLSLDLCGSFEANTLSCKD